MSREKRLFNRLTHVIKIRRERVDKLSQSVVFRQPERLYDGHLQKLDRLCERLSVLTENKVANMKHRYELSAGKLIPTYGKIVEAKKNKTEQLYQSLLLLDISKIKARGFSLVTDEKGKIIKSVSDVKKGQTLDVELTDGKVIVEVK